MLEKRLLGRKSRSIGFEQPNQWPLYQESQDKHNQRQLNSVLHAKFQNEQ